MSMIAKNSSSSRARLGSKLRRRFFWAWPFQGQALLFFFSNNPNAIDGLCIVLVKEWVCVRESTMVRAKVGDDGDDDDDDDDERLQEATGKF
ncbi:hypothetical protein VNO80_23973 [Phaseolus coccineus]|uniref:Uncharacterized protein n=1 Tax=Phaseolus coccineus TaxID=3886 RepID=A0AAN9LV70_PHACN